MNTQLVIPSKDHVGRFKFVAADDTETPRSASGSITISDYAHAYVARNTADGAVYVKPNPAVFPTTPGSSLSLSVTVAGNDAAGNALPVLTVDVTLQGPPLPPNATHLTITEAVVADNFTPPADPGGATITF